MPRCRQRGAQSLGRESDRILFGAAPEHGALSLAARRSENGPRRRDCPKPSIPGALALRCGLSYRLRGNAVVHAAVSAGQNDLINIPAEAAEFAQTNRRRKEPAVSVSRGRTFCACTPAPRRTSTHVFPGAFVPNSHSAPNRSWATFR